MIMSVTNEPSPKPRAVATSKSKALGIATDMKRIFVSTVSVFWSTMTVARIARIALPASLSFCFVVNAMKRNMSNEDALGNFDRYGRFPKWGRHNRKDHAP